MLRDLHAHGFSLLTNSLKQIAQRSSTIRPDNASEPGTIITAKNAEPVSMNVSAALVILELLQLKPQAQNALVLVRLMVPMGSSRRVL